MARVILVRHPPVGAHWGGRCYGQSEVGLSRIAMRENPSLVASLASFAPDRLFSSPLRRARWLAGHLSLRLDMPLTIDDRLKECHFGTWEGRSWEAIWSETGSAMNGMIEAPESFRPGGGETTYEVRDRVQAWLASLPGSGTTLAVTHGGPIASILGTLKRLPVAAWPSLVPKAGSWVEL
ncbi:MAG: histidine phosphatase family protein [Hyphomicrobium sp.]